MDTENFLFGNESGEAFDSFLPENAERTFESIETFRRVIETLLTEFGWDEKRQTTVEFHEATQVFNMPDDDTLMKWYKKYDPPVAPKRFQSEDDFINSMGGSRQDLVAIAFGCATYDDFIAALPYRVNEDDVFVGSFWFNFCAANQLSEGE